MWNHFVGKAKKTTEHLLRDLKNLKNGLIKYTY